MDANVKNALEQIMELAARGYSSERVGQECGEIIEIAHYIQHQNPVVEGRLTIEIVKVVAASNWDSFYVDGLLRYSEEALVKRDELKKWLIALAHEIAEKHYNVEPENVDVVFKDAEDYPEAKNPYHHPLFHACELPARLTEYLKWRVFGENMYRAKEEKTE